MKKWLALGVLLLLPVTPTFGQEMSFVVGEMFENGGEWSTMLGMTYDLNEVLGFGVTSEVTEEQSITGDILVTPLSVGDLTLTAILGAGHQWGESWMHAKGVKIDYALWDGVKAFGGYNRQEPFEEEKGTSSDLYFVGIEMPFSGPF
jgi:hypothetical protein